MSNEAFKDREHTLNEQAAVLEADFRRLAGEPAFTTDEIREMLRERRSNVVV